MILRLRRWFSRLHSTRTIWSSLVPRPAIALLRRLTSCCSDSGMAEHGMGMYTELATPGQINFFLPDFSPSRTVYSYFSPRQFWPGHWTQDGRQPPIGALGGRSPLWRSWSRTLPQEAEELPSQWWPPAPELPSRWWPGLVGPEGPGCLPFRDSDTPRRALHATSKRYRDRVRSVDLNRSALVSHFDAS